VVRETWEETGLLVKPVGTVGLFCRPAFVVRYSNGDETQYVMTVFERLEWSSMQIVPFLAESLAAGERYLTRALGSLIRRRVFE
jgi:8-oxo-dGTP pyrophosphatase MutT (NUDIX family)